MTEGEQKPPLVRISAIQRESRWFIKTALLFLLATVGMGVVFVLCNVSGRGYSYEYVVVHTHVGLIGFVLNMILGVAYWMFPRLPGQYPETKGKYDLRLAWASYFGVNGGLVLRAASEPAAMTTREAAWVAAYLGAVALLAAGIVVAVLILWPRVR